MANNPIDTNSFQHFLLIRGVEYEIIEPVNFDKSNFKCEQNNYARDTFYGNENDLLEFYQNYGSQGMTYMDNDGVLISHIPSGLDLLLQENKDNGSESDVKYILKKDGIEFTTGNFDFTTAQTDDVSYFKCKVIQNTNQSKIKKREKINIDLFSDKDLDDNAITPIVTQRMLLKAKPIYQESEWDKISSEFENQTGTIDVNISPFNNVLRYGIDNTLSFLSNIRSSVFSDPYENFSLVEAKDTLTNVKIIIDLGFETFGFGSTPIETLTVRSGSMTTFVNSNYQLIHIQSEVGVYRNTITVNFDKPVIAGERIEVVFENIGNTKVNFSIANVKITATSTAESSVINAVRWIDLIKQNYKGIGSLQVNAQKFDVGGDFYNNFCFNKNLIKQNITKPFNIKLTDTVESLQEVNADSQINENEIYIGQHIDFYKNIDMGGFLIKPDFESEFIKNERYLVNEFNFGYEKYEQDRTERNTIDAIHTNSQWFPQVQNSINTKEIKLPFIRDPFITEVARRIAFSNSDNSTSDDENIFIADVIELAPNSKLTLTRYLTYQSDGNGTFKILSDNTFRWDLLGFNVGDVVTENGNDRTVLAISSTILQLSNTDFSGSQNTQKILFEITYPLTNVLYTNRTNEGLIFSENLRNSDNFGNLRYSIKRNMRHWLPNLATYGKFILNKKIKNTFFKANGEAITQFLGEQEPIKENEDILVSDISEFKILNQNIFKTIVSCSFEQAVNLLDNLQNVRGFIRVQAPDGRVIKGYVKESNFIWSLDELNLEIECKNESDFLTIFSDGANQLTINEVGYDTRIVSEKRYNIFNDYIQFFDLNNVNLCNRIKFDKVLLNGQSYETVTELVNAIELL
jgi:hypothetical protein